MWPIWVRGARWGGGVHPVTPIIGEQLFLFMEPASRRTHLNATCAMRSIAPGNPAAKASSTSAAGDDADPAHRQQTIAAASRTPQARHVLFILSVEHAFMNVYLGGQSDRHRGAGGRP